MAGGTISTLIILFTPSVSFAQAASAPASSVKSNVTQSTPSTSATASADKGIGYGQMTKDGREFGKLTEKEVDGLGDTEYDAYQKWKIAQKNATLIKT